MSKNRLIFCLLVALLLSLSPSGPTAAAPAADKTVQGADGTSGIPGADAAETVPAGASFADTTVRGGRGEQAVVDFTDGGRGGNAELHAGDGFSAQGAFTVQGGAGGAGIEAGFMTYHGGAGGNAVFTGAGSVTSSGAVSITGGAGGKGGLVMNSSFGGDGGQASLLVNGAFSSGQSLSISGGRGGDAGDFAGYGQNGGAGGNAVFTGAGSVTSFGAVSITGGAGGKGGQAIFSSFGGDGGQASLLVNGAFSSGQSLSISGGRGGDAGDMLGDDQNGGAGGNATFSAASTVVAGPLSISSGASGTSSGQGAPGAGGGVNFHAGSLRAPTINLTKQDGALNVNVGTLAVGQNTALTVTGTNAADIRIGTLAFNLTGVNSGATMLSTSGMGNIGILASGLRMGLAGGGPVLPSGYSVTLIDDSSNTPLSGGAAPAALHAQQGTTLAYDFGVTRVGDTLTATLSGGPYASPQTKALSEGKLAGHAFLNQGSDLIIGPAMYSILAQPKPEGGLVPFAVGMGGSSRYDTGSHVDVDGFSMLTGLAWRQPLNDKGSNILFGAFFEAGWGGYDSHNSFDNWASVKGDGDISYYGGGVLARYGAACGGYFDASFRAGQVKTDFSSGDLRDAVSGQKSDYDSSSAYYGAHAGIGYVWSITEKASLDFSTRYLWTHQDSDSVNVSGDPVRFQAIDSQRWRTGARFAYAVNEYVAPYAGAYYDHEFDGKARATTYGYNIDAPDLKGGTGVGELGLTIKPVADSGFSMDLGVQGYTGVREGVSGSLQLKFEF